MPVLHVLLKYWASGLRIKATPVPGGQIHWVCMLEKDFVLEGKGTLCQRGGPKVMGVYQPYFCGILKKLKAKKLAHEKNQGYL